MKYVLLLALGLSLGGCYRNHRDYGYSDRSGYSDRDERNRHDHIDAERDHLRQEQDEEARRHGGSYRY